MQHLFLPHKLAILAKQKCFNEPCFGYYSGDNPYGELPDKLNIIACKKEQSVDDLFGRCLAPLYQQIVDWFRDEYDLQINILGHLTIGFEYCISKNKKVKHAMADLSCKTYYEALNKAIEEAFKLI